MVPTCVTPGLVRDAIKMPAYPGECEKHRTRPIFKCITIPLLTHTFNNVSNEKNISDVMIEVTALLTFFLSSIYVQYTMLFEVGTRYST